MMTYASVEDVKDAFNVEAIATLTDDTNGKEIIDSIVKESIGSASSFVERVLPTRFLTDLRVTKYICVQKVIALLYRRYGYEDSASNIEKSIDVTIKRMIEASAESGRTSYSRDIKSSSVPSLVSKDAWRNACKIAIGDVE